MAAATTTNAPLTGMVSQINGMTMPLSIAGSLIDAWTT